MKPSQVALRGKRIEQGALARANEASALDPVARPDWLRTLRVWQDVMIGGIKMRNQVIRKYLAERTKRVIGHETPK